MSEASTTTKPAQNKSEAETGSASAKLPGAGAFDVDAARKAAASDADGERNEVFTSLVTGDADIVGLVAYSIYKQNKHDWLVAFNKHKSREPSEVEAYSYIVGESTPRRLATYRHLAEATLEGRGPQVSMGPATEKFVQRSFSNATSAPSASGGGKVAWIIAAIVAIAAILAAGKYGIPGLR